MNYFYDCIDCGTEYCPCELAVTGDCSVCTRLSGAGCDCDWKGVCVYSELMQGGGMPKGRRREFEAAVIEKREYGEDTFVLVLDTGRSFAQRCRRPGSFVFMKAPADDAFYDAPISLLRADERRGEIHVAIRKSGPKTRRLEAACDSVTVRGIYRNGILGVRNLIGTRGRVDTSDRLMIITKGIGFAPAANYLDWTGGRVRTDFFIDRDKIDEKLINDYMPSCAKHFKTADDAPVHIHYINLQRALSYRSKHEESLESLYEKGNYTRVLVLASDYYTDEIGKRIRIDARANNFHMCCGEGICGACGFTDSDGKCYRMCKCAAINTGNC